MQFKRILITVDSSPLSGLGLTEGYALADLAGAEVALVHVVDTNLAYAPEAGIMVAQIISDLRISGQKLLDSASEKASPSRSKPLQMLREGQPGDEIVRAAQEWTADIIVIATHGRSGFSRMLLGSTAEHVLRHSPCSILAVKERKQ